MAILLFSLKGLITACGHICSPSLLKCLAIFCWTSSQSSGLSAIPFAEWENLPQSAGPRVSHYCYLGTALGEGTRRKQERISVLKESDKQVRFLLALTLSYTWNLERWELDSSVI